MQMQFGMDVSSHRNSCGCQDCICAAVSETETQPVDGAVMTGQLTPRREIRFVEGFTPYARCKGDGGTITGWAEIIEITLLPTGWVQVDHDDGTTMFYPQQVIASLKNPLIL